MRGPGRLRALRSLSLRAEEPLQLQLMGVGARPTGPCRAAMQAGQCPPPTRSPAPSRPHPFHPLPQVPLCDRHQQVARGIGQPTLLASPLRRRGPT